jgi:hypothetical protein
MPKGCKAKSAKYLIGLRVGRWLVIEKGPRREKDHRQLWVCKCSCGTIKLVATNLLTCGTSRSCGCLVREIASKTHRTHGHAGRNGSEQTTEYSAWVSMIQRCTNKNCKNYKRYGARGIKVCKAWRKSFEAFFQDMGKKPKGYTLERINNEHGYYPNNCRWASYLDQEGNRGNIVKVEYEGKIQGLSKWARELGVSLSLLVSRLKNGWSVKRAFTEPPHKKNVKS